MKVQAVGDLMLGDSVSAVGYGFRSRYGDGDLVSVFEDLAPVFAGADLVLGNLEVPLPPGPFDPHDRHEAQLRGHPGYARALRAAGFDVLSIANNHADQHGPEALRSTIETLEAAGMRCCGVRGDGRPWHSIPVRLTVGGTTVGILGYSLRPPQYGASPPYAQGPVESLIEDLSRLRDTVDNVVVSLHWGREYVDEPSAEEVETGRRLIDAGAHLVLGHHPHVVRPVEAADGGIIAYSLGNAVSDMIWQERLRIGLIAEIELRSGTTPRVRIRRTRTDNEYVPRLHGEWEERLPNRVEGLGEAEYRRAERRALNRYRVAAYAHALRMAPSTPRRVLLDLVRDTLAGKVRALLPRRMGP